MKFFVIAFIIFSISCSKTDNGTILDSEQTEAETDTTDTETGDADEKDTFFCNVLEKVAEKHIDVSGVRNKAIGMIIRVESPEISKTCAFGSVIKGENTPPEGSEQWVIGSVSKMITSFIMAQKAVELKELSDHPAKNYLPPEWAVPDGSGDEKFTLTHLMTHTSGLPRYPPTLQESIKNASSLEDMYAAWEEYTIDDLERDLAETTLEFDPETNYYYSDYGFALVQKATEEIYEKPFPKILADFSKLMGLKNTVVPENLSENQKSNLFYGHGGPNIVPMPKPVVTPVFTGDGFIYSDAEDMGKLLRIFTGIDESPNENAINTLELLKEKRFPREAEEISVAQGLGIGIITEGDFTLYKKNGTSAGTTTAFLWDEKNHLGVVAAGNVIPFSEGVNLAVCEAYSIIAENSDIEVPSKVVKSCQIAF